LAAGLYATVADRAGRSAAAERLARVEAVQARKAAETASGAAQEAQQAMQQIAAQAEADKETAQRENYRSTIKLAESMLRGDVQAKYHVADILWGAQPEMRGWEWGHLMAHCPLEEWSLQTRHDGLDTLVASSDGRLLATAGRDGTVALWDTWTRKELWRQRTGRVKTLAIDPKSRYVGVGSAEASQRAFRILDIAAGRLVHEAAGTGSGDIAFSPAGNDFFVLGDRELERFGIDPWALLKSVSVSRSNLPAEHILWLFVDSAGAFVGVQDDGVGPLPGLSADHPRCSLFDAQTLKRVTELDPILPTYARNLRSLARPALHSGLGAIAYSDGPKLCVDDFSSRNREIDHPSIVTCLAFDPRSNVAIAASHDGAVTLRDGDGEIRTIFHGSPIRGLTLFPDGRLVTGGADGLIKCWNPNLAANLAASTSPETESASSDFVAFAEGGNRLLFQNFVRKQNWLFELSDLSYRVVLGPEGYGHGFPLIQAGTNELVADDETGLSFFSLFRKGAGVVKSRSIDFARPYGAAFDASGRILVVSNLDQQVAVFDVDSHKRLAVPKAQGMGLVAVNPAGTRAALLSGTSLQVWDMATGRVLNRLDEPYGKFRLENDEPVPNSHWLLTFHPNGDLVAFVKPSENSSSTIVLWDSVLGKTRQAIQTEPGRRIRTFEFSPDGNRIFTDDGAIWDWRIGKELLALSGARATNAVAPSPDGVTLALAGWNPSLRVAKALPWNKLTQRDEGFYRALDDLRTYTVHVGRSRAKGQEQIADQAEILGDVELRRGQAAPAVAHYSRAIEIRQTIVRGDASKAFLQYRLATLYEKRLALTGTSDPAGGALVLKEAVEFWQKLVASGRSHQVARRFLLDLELRLADLELARSGKGAKEFLLPEIALWCAQSKKGADDRLVRYGLRELWARSAAAVPGLRGDQKAIDDLVERHPELTVTIGDQYAAGGNWDRALAIFSKAITPGSGIEHVRKLLELGGIGPGKSEAPLDVAAKAKLRRRALIWLKAELTGATKLLESGPPALRPAIDEALDAWTGREEIREAQARAKLPADERKAWQTLWADVDSLRKRVPAPDAMATNPEILDPQALELVHRQAHSLEPAKPREAEPLFRQALEGYRKTQGPDAHLTIDLTLDLARVLDRLGRGDEAEPLIVNALERARKQFSSGDPRIAHIVNGLATSLSLRGKWAAGEPVFREALERARKSLGPEDSRLSGFMAPLGQSLIEQGKWLDAEPVLRECMAIREKLQPDDWSTFNTRSLLGASLLGQKKFAEAEPLVLSGYEGLKAREARIPPQGKARLKEAADRVVKLYEAWEKKDKAADWRAKLAGP
jgi:WD40 repeat protein/tetratricopeptide (TPR) repeat protein